MATTSLIEDLKNPPPPYLEAEIQRQNIEQMRRLPVAFAKDGSPVSLEQVATLEEVFNPEVIRRQNLQRREAVYAGVQGRPSGDVNADVQKLIKETELPPGISFMVDGDGKQQADFMIAFRRHGEALRQMLFDGSLPDWQGWVIREMIEEKYAQFGNKMHLGRPEWLLWSLFGCAALAADAK